MLEYSSKTDTKRNSVYCSWLWHCLLWFEGGRYVTQGDFTKTYASILIKHEGFPVLHGINTINLPAALHPFHLFLKICLLWNAWVIFISRRHERKPVSHLKGGPVLVRERKPSISCRSERSDQLLTDCHVNWCGMWSAMGWIIWSIKCKNMT